MNNYKIENTIKYLSFTLVISYFIFHKIILVFLGILLSLSIINDNSRYLFIKSKENKQVNKKIIEIDRSIRTKDSVSKSKNKIRKLSLVEQVEELGFIPSIENDEEQNTK
tara:strand:+ start:162 stop:491 length:330 start_codon:yes stop_codon:yes gene_type:complete